MLRERARIVTVQNIRPGEPGHVFYFVTSESTPTQVLADWLQKRVGPAPYICCSESEPIADIVLELWNAHVERVQASDPHGLAAIKTRGNA